MSEKGKALTGTVESAAKAQAKKAASAVTEAAALAKASGLGIIAGEIGGDDKRRVMSFIEYHVRRPDEYGDKAKAIELARLSLDHGTRNVFS